MIIITRHYDVENSSGGRMLHNVTRKVFPEDAIEQIQSFLDERSTVPGYEWHNLDFTFIKL